MGREQVLWELGQSVGAFLVGLGIWNEAGQRLIEFCQENTLVIANTVFQQHKRRLYTWTSWDGQHRNQIDYILCSQRWRSSIQSAKTRLGSDCGSDHKLLFAKFRLKLKKVGKTTRPFRYDLNQIPYVYTVEVRNRFMGLDLIDRVNNFSRFWDRVAVPSGLAPPLGWLGQVDSSLECDSWIEKVGGGRALDGLYLKSISLGEFSLVFG